MGEGNIDGGDGPFFKKNGNHQATHSINMGFKKLLNLSTPSKPFEAPTKEYVDDKEDAIKKEVDDKDVAIRSYMDDNVDDIKQIMDNVSAINNIYIDKKPHIIVVNAQCSGKLLPGKYQFAFAGSAIDHDERRLGFVVPQIGFIKKGKS